MTEIFLRCTSKENFREKVFLESVYFVNDTYKKKKKKKKLSLTINKCDGEMQFGASYGKIISQSRECSYFFH